MRVHHYPQTRLTILVPLETLDSLQKSLVLSGEAAVYEIQGHAARERGPERHQYDNRRT